MLRLPLSLRLALAVGFFISAFTISSTQIFLRWTKLLPYFDYPVYQYWLYLLDYVSNPDPRLKWYLILSGAVPLLIIGIVLCAAYKKSTSIKTWDLKRPGGDDTPNHDPPRSPSTLYGNDRLITVSEQMALWPAQDTSRGYIVIGEAYDPTKLRGHFSPRQARSWGPGGTAPLLADLCTDDFAPHAIRFGGTGSGKTSCIVTDGCHFRSSMVFNDPSIELAPILARTRMQMGHRVIAMATERKDIERLQRIRGLRVGGANVLAHIPDDDPEEAEIQAKNAAEWVCGYTPEWSSTHSYFTAQGKDLVLCLAADMLCDPKFPKDARNLMGLRMLIADPDLPTRLARIHVDSVSSVARSFAGELYTISRKAEETWMSIYTTANAQTRWITFPRYARLVCGDDFSTDDIAVGDTDVFICLSLETQMAEPAVARCIVGALIGAIKRADGTNDWIAFELEEAAHIGRMKELESLPHVGRKYRTKVIFHYQNIHQPRRQFGSDALDELIDSCGWVSYMAISSQRTAKHIEERLGGYGAIRWSQSESKSRGRGQFGSWSRGTSYSETGVPLRRASAITTLRRDAQVVISGSGDKAICGVPFYYRRPELVDMVDRNRFVRP